MTRINDTNRKPKELTVPVNIGTDHFVTGRPVISLLKQASFEERKGHFQLIACISSVNEATNTF